MLEVISKRQYWDALADPIVKSHLERTNRKMICLKHVQDAWVLSKIAGVQNQIILEAGGGFGRVLRTLDNNERWNLDIQMGVGRTVAEKKRIMPVGINGVDGYLGEFSEKVPSDYFDIVYSISVIEHITAENVENFFIDHTRILKNGGFGFHAIDFYLGNSELPNVEKRLTSYIEGIEKSKLRFVEDQKIVRPLIFNTSNASTPDLTMLHLNTIIPQLAQQRALLQSVSLALVVQKVED